MIYIILILVIAVLFVPLKKAINTIKSDGFTPGNVVFLVFILFYIFIPFIYLLFPQYRDDSTLFNVLLSKNSNETIAICICLMTTLIAFYFFCYNKSSNLGVLNLTSRITEWDKINNNCESRIRHIADFCFIAGAISVFVCMQAVGGLMSYLAFGVNMRGLDKDVTMTIDSSLLPLITLSAIVLVPPYLYKTLLQLDNRNKFLKLKFFLSLVLATTYLLYNQGRLPLLLFFVPFVLDLNFFRKQSIFTLFLLALGSVFLLSILDALFIYFSFGYWDYEDDSSFLNTLLLEFTYPFSNFINRDTLLEQIGLRYGYDYFVWFLLLIPASILSPLGIIKKEISTIGLLNTEAYGKVLGMPLGGGIPTDFFTFNYYQFGWLSLIPAIILSSLILRKLDSIVIAQRNNPIARLITLRICFLMISLINNFDLSVIFRMRFDLIILIYVLFYINKVSVQLEPR